MTREQAKREIDSLDYYLQNHTDDYGEESHTAMMMAIKALEQEPCEDCINRQIISDYVESHIQEINTGYGDLNKHTNEILRMIVDYIENMPPVTPKQKIGHWIFDEILDRHYYCSECKSMGVDYWDYCPNCGAKMEEVEEK